MANLKGLGSIVAQLREERTNLVNQLRHVDAALSVLGKLDGGRSYTKPRRRRLSAAARKISWTTSFMCVLGTWFVYVLLKVGGAAISG